VYVELAAGSAAAGVPADGEQPVSARTRAHPTAERTTRFTVSSARRDGASTALLHISEQR
jgi:hypothetical protein